MLNLDPAKLVVILVLALVVMGPEKMQSSARHFGTLWRSVTEFREKAEQHGQRKQIAHEGSLFCLASRVFAVDRANLCALADITRHCLAGLERRSGNDSASRSCIFR